MNNLTQTKQDAKQAYLDKQREQMLDQYQKADAIECAAINKQIDSFLSVIPKDAQIFWLKFRERLERLKELKPHEKIGKFK